MSILQSAYLRGRWDEARWRRLVELHNQGLSTQATADALGEGLTRSAVAGARYRAGMRAGIVYRFEDISTTASGITTPVVVPEPETPPETPPAAAERPRRQPRSKPKASHRCRMLACSATRQPGRQHCAECLRAAMPERRRAGMAAVGVGWR